MSERLYEAIKNKDKEKVAKLLKGGWFRNAIDVNAHFENGETPLIAAIHNKDYEMFKFLIKNGADLNQTDTKGNTPLMEAVWVADRNMMEDLLSGGVDTTIWSQQGFSVVDIAMIKGLRCWGEYATFLEFLDERGVDIGMQNENGQNVLSVMCRCQDVTRSWAEIMKYLVDKGIDVNVSTVEGMTPLMKAAAESDSVELVEQLIQHGADMYAQDQYGRTVDDFANKRISAVLSKLKTNGVVNAPVKRKSKKMSLNDKLKDKIDQMSGADLVKLTEQDATFMQQLVTTGLVVEALQKMSYDETKALYQKTKKAMTPEVRALAEDVIRHKR